MWDSRSDTGLHVGVEDARLGLDDAHGAIEGLNGEELALAIRQNSGDVQTNILGVHLGREAVRDGLLLAGGNLGAIASGSQVANHLAFLIQSPQAASEEVYSDGVRLIVGDGDQSFGRTTIDKLDAKDLRGGERSLGLDGKVGNLGFRDRLGILMKAEYIMSVN